eukprot:GHVS01037944.1.p1 GENE.GHVS01037944.1~~GHVS01037944.1.p1  ORF type:complete len:583 (+),score=72.76 GHVS01037944.1:539-2287(+)
MVEGGDDQGTFAFSPPSSMEGEGRENWVKGGRVEGSGGTGGPRVKGKTPEDGVDLTDERMGADTDGRRREERRRGKNAAATMADNSGSAGRRRNVIDERPSHRVIDSPDSPLSRFSLFGHYINEQALRNVDVWKYKSGGSTQLDRLMNPWWEFVARYTPKMLAPNLLTLYGFICTITALTLVLVYMPTLEEEAPRWLYFTVAILLFIHQTADAVDGKHARNTGTSSPLGQIFDHGCDAFSTIFAVFVNAAAARLGLSWATFTLLGLLQMQMFIYTWWELHFHVYRCSTGATGVTEGQFIMMGVNIAAGVFGPSVYLMTVDDVVPHCTTEIVRALGLSGLRFQAIVATPFYLLLMYMVLEDLYKGCRTAPEKSCIQLVGCVAHIIVQYFFYASGLMRLYPCLCCLIIIANSSIVALRMNISAACKIPLSAIHWPAIPFYVVGVFLYITGHVRPKEVGGWTRGGHGNSVLEGWDPRITICVLVCMLLWAVVYLTDFMWTAVNDICGHLGIYCFSTDRRVVAGEVLGVDCGGGGTTTKGMKRRTEIGRASGDEMKEGRGGEKWKGGDGGGEIRKRRKSEEVLVDG